jgi:hypothetical protein
LVLLGPNLPHLYCNAKEYYGGSPFKAKAITVHFVESSFGDFLCSGAETKTLKSLLLKAERGLHIIGRTSETVAQMLHDLLLEKDFDRCTKLLEILLILSQSTDYYFISTGLKDVDEDSNKMNKVIDYVVNNFNKEIFRKQTHYNSY